MRIWPGFEFSFEGNVNGATGRSGDEVYADYAARYGDGANPAYVALAYDAATLLLRAIEEVARWRTGIRFTLTGRGCGRRWRIRPILRGSSALFRVTVLVIAGRVGFIFRIIRTRRSVILRSCRLFTGMSRKGGF